MKNLFLATLTAAALASSAGAGGLTVSLPNLTFPPSDDVTITKTCLPDAAAAGICTPAQ